MLPVAVERNRMQRADGLPPSCPAATSGSEPWLHADGSPSCPMATRTCPCGMREPVVGPHCPPLPPHPHPRNRHARCGTHREAARCRQQLHAVRPGRPHAPLLPMPCPCVMRLQAPTHLVERAQALGVHARFLPGGLRVAPHLVGGAIKPPVRSRHGAVGGARDVSSVRGEREGRLSPSVWYVGMCRKNDTAQEMERWRGWWRRWRFDSHGRSGRQQRALGGGRGASGLVGAIGAIRDGRLRSAGAGATPPRPPPPTRSCSACVCVQVKWMAGEPTADHSRLDFQDRGARALALPEVAVPLVELQVGSRCAGAGRPASSPPPALASRGGSHGATPVRSGPTTWLPTPRTSVQ